MSDKSGFIADGKHRLIQGDLWCPGLGRFVVGVERATFYAYYETT